MIVFDLLCDVDGDRFEAWFASSRDFEKQVATGLVQCPTCGSAKVRKAPMAPRLGRKAREADRLAQTEILKNSEWVGRDFADLARAMHEGEQESRKIHGEATIAEAISLSDDGVPIAPLPLPMVPPRQVN